MKNYQSRNAGRFLSFFLILVSLSISHNTNADAGSDFWVGAGIHDITGPAADVMMMGYVHLKQTTAGIHTRLRSRAFVISDPRSGKRVAMVTIDQMSVPDAVTSKVIEKLRARFGDLYTEANTLIAATHTHSAPGGFSRYHLYDFFTSKGFSQQNFQAIVNGIYASIVKAHQNSAPATITMAEGELLDASVSRSSDAYLRNPASERGRFSGNVDRNMTLLKFTGLDGAPIGTINWFAVHATSMKKNNNLISADNKGYAAMLFEKALGTNYRSPKGFVAAFANSNAGDSSPSSGGADVDENGDWICALRDNFKCTEQNAKRQWATAKQLFDSAQERLSTVVDYRHAFIDMSNVTVRAEFATGADGREQKTCFGAIGLSMLAGTKDGWGVGREKQTCADPSLIGGALCALHSCHGQKPVVLATGLKGPYPWTPQILPLQIIRLGELAIVAVPAEFTTMSGRRLRKTVQLALAGIGVRQVVLSGYSNSYAGYVATREEYQMQNYEGASTHFGEWTLAAYQQEFSNLAKALAEKREVPPGPQPLDTSAMKELQIPGKVGADTVPAGLRFGSVVVDAKQWYRREQTVAVQFWGAYPNNDLLTQSSFLEVQKLDHGNWSTVADDGDYETKFIWERKQKSRSLVTVQWAIPITQAPGNYRVLHRGVSKSPRGTLAPYQGVSSSFRVN